MKINIYYFSGTGNTRWVAQCLSNKLNSLGNEVRVMSCEEDNISITDLDTVDMIGVAFPIYSSFPPRIVKNFLLKLPEAKNKSIFGIATAGYTAGDVVWYTLKDLKSKGYKPFLYGNIVMGNNLHLPRLSPLRITSPIKMEKRLEKAETKITKLAELINNRVTHREGINLLGRLLGITQRTIAEKFEDFAFKGFDADESCVRCDLCVKNCLVNNITIKDGKIIFLDNCILCMRCYSFCPTKSIQYTEKTKDIEKYGRYMGPEENGYLSLKRK